MSNAANILLLHVNNFEDRGHKAKVTIFKAKANAKKIELDATAKA